MRYPSIHHAFVNWLETAGSRFAVGVRVTGRAGQHIELSFDDITPALGAFLSSRELTVFVDWEGQNWDSPLSLDVTPRRCAGGYICECCKPEGRTVFPTLDALWGDHLFEPFLEWVNEELASLLIPVRRSLAALHAFA